MTTEPKVEAHTPPRRRGSYAKSQVRRRQILEAAREVFATSGYRGSSLKEIAAIVGINSTSIFHYYPTKEALLQAVLDQRDAESDEVAEGVPEVGASVPLALLALAKHNESKPGIISLFTLLAAEASTPDHPSGDYFIARYRHTRSRFEEGFQLMAREGLLAPGVDAEYAAISTLTLWEGAQMQWLIEPGAIDVVEVLRRHLSLITTVDLPG